MKVLMINGSPRVDGNTTVALNEMKEVFEKEGIEVSLVQIGNRDIRGCIACNQCAKTGKCVFDDAVNELASEFEEADGLVVASPVYYASANATVVAFLDRLFYSTHFDKSMKVGASVVVARRGGISSTCDEINKFSQSVECLLHRVNIGIQSIVVNREKFYKMKKDYKQCVF